MSGKKLNWLFTAAIQIHFIYAHFPSNTECGMTRQCYPSACPDNECTFQLSWMEVADTNYVHFVMTFEASAGDQWIAAGFSKDQQMPDSSIVMCKSEDGSTSVEMGHTTGRQYFTSSNNYGLMDTAVSHNGSIITCSFKRIIAPTQNQDKVFALNQALYLLYARGNVNSGIPLQHNGYQRFFSSSTFVFSSSGSPMLTTTPSSATFSTISQSCFLLSLLVCLIF